MKISFFISAFLTTVISAIPMLSSAELFDRGGGLIYDDVLDITWLQDANYALTNGDDADGYMNWYEADSWVTNLSYYDSIRDVIYDDWRLPVTDGTFNPFGLFAPTDCRFVTEEVCRGSELGYMYYYNLGGNQGDDLTGDQSPFINIGNVYWFGTDNPNDNSAAYGFIFGAGGGGLYQLYAKSTIFNNVWAVRDGDIGIPPSSVAIDILPRNNTDLNVIHLNRGDNIKVAILGGITFDALQVDPASVMFGPMGAAYIRYKVKDYNRDGYPDLILTFKLSETGIACGDLSAVLTGQTFPDPVIEIEGVDTFTVEPCP